MIDIAQLKALAEFLDELTELSNRTGVAIGGHLRPTVEVNGEVLTVDVQRDQSGNVVYALDLREP